MLEKDSLKIEGVQSNLHGKKKNDLKDVVGATMKSVELKQDLIPEDDTDSTQYD